MGPWEVFKGMIKALFFGGFIVQRGWGCRGCLVGFFWFIGIGYLLMALISVPDAGNLVPAHLALIIAVVFIAIAIVVGKLLRPKTDSDKTFTGRGKPD